MNIYKILKRLFYIKSLILNKKTKLNLNLKVNLFFN